jgi:hypothetical protein
MVFCDCEEQCITLLRWGFWASSPKRPWAAYAWDLMMLLQAVTLECQAAASSFVQMLRWKNNLSETEVCACCSFNFKINFTVVTRKNLAELKV